MDEEIAYKLSMLDLLLEAIKSLQNAQANIDACPEDSEAEAASWHEYDKAQDDLFELADSYQYTMSDESLRHEREVTLLRLPLRITHTA